jgi:hypothetical protein
MGQRQCGGRAILRQGLELPASPVSTRVKTRGSPAGAEHPGATSTVAGTAAPIHFAGISIMLAHTRVRGRKIAGAAEFIGNQTPYPALVIVTMRDMSSSRPWLRNCSMASLTA